jgi:hypothetical protein
MSITLTTPFTVSLNGVQVENDTNGACIGYSMDYIGRQLTYYFNLGTLAGSPTNLVSGPQAQIQNKNIQVTVYVGSTTATQTFGQWYLNGVLQGSLVPAATLNPIVTQLLANRNSAESFVAVAGGLLPGSVTAWTAL